MISIDRLTHTRTCVHTMSINTLHDMVPPPPSPWCPPTNPRRTDTQHRTVYCLLPLFTTLQRGMIRRQTDGPNPRSRYVLVSAPCLSILYTILCRYMLTLSREICGVWVYTLPPLPPSPPLPSLPILSSMEGQGQAKEGREVALRDARLFSCLARTALFISRTLVVRAVRFWAYNTV